MDTVKESLEVKNVIEIFDNSAFLIPSYQRGYRWGEREIEALLDDLRDFIKSNQKTYLLQPIVVRTLCDNEFNRYREKHNIFNGKIARILVDGQQRLTTLSIIITVFNETLREKNNSIQFVPFFWDMVLDKMIDDPSLDKDINMVFRESAKATVENWIKRIPEQDKESIILSIFDVFQANENEKRVVIIKYEIGKKDEHKTFIRLNAGKIPLTSAELIRALFMTSSELSVEKKMEIAKEWEAIETFLHNPSVWIMINNQNEYEVRINLLFEIISGKNDRVLPLNVFSELEKSITADPKDEWNQVLRLYDFLRSCFFDYRTYNYLGFLSYLKLVPLRMIHKSIQNNNREIITEILRQRILHYFMGNSKDLPKISDYRYKCDKLKEFLLLLNVLFCNKREEFFNYSAFIHHEKEKAWDIEHIESQTKNEMNDKETQDQWLEHVYDVMSKIMPHKIEFIKTMPKFEDQKKAIHDLFVDPGVDLDGIGNLVLLNCEINRGYKNAIFPVKRQWIINSFVKENAFIPPCTVAAFMKLYNDGATEMFRWNSQDAVTYAKKMDELFSEFCSLQMTNDSNMEA